MTQPSARWTALLDAIDEGLASSPPLFLEALPTDADPLPVALAARAANTLRRMAEAEAALEQARAEVSRELSALSAVKAVATAGTAPSTPRFLDTKA